MDITTNKMEREIIKGNGFYISYHPMTDKGKETALVNETKRPRFLILLGDYREEFRPLVDSGYQPCVRKFKSLLKEGAVKSTWSE